MVLTKRLGYKTGCETVLALGTFDGMHIGHRKVVSTAVSVANEMGIKSAVWCFSAPPKNAPAINMLEEKAEIMGNLGVDIIVSPAFNDEIKHLSPQAFFDNVIVGDMSAKCVVCGFNYTFGYKGKGDVKLMESLCREGGIGFICIEPVVYDGEAVSSTKIRALIAENDTEKVNILLGK